MKTFFFLTLDAVSVTITALVLGFLMAYLAYVMDGPNWLVDAVGWTVFGGVGVKLWTMLRGMNREPITSKGARS